MAPAPLGVPVISCTCEVCTSADPRDQRLRSSLLLENADDKIIIDCGPDFRQQMISINMDFPTGIIITHGHRDHIAGLDDIRGFNFIHRKPVEIFIPQHSLHAIQTEFPYIFNPGNYKRAPSANIHTLKGENFTVGSTTFTPLPCLHNLEEVWGYKTGNFAYITDASSISEETIDLLSGIDYLVLNALRIKPHPSHFSLEQAIDLVLRVIKPGKVWFTHISHFMGLHADASEFLPEGISLAYDGLSVELS
ncbi:MAG: MBL fold metallo-hydrolase [Bacteroidetes bacterium]|nr:MBL fold metallo-hydrolase [Bacteroidota bacterium]